MKNDPGFTEGKGRNAFIEEIDYRTTGKTSIWGPGDKATLALLHKHCVQGKWLNLAAGDGRYNLELLKKVDSVVASDIDESALEKLRRQTPARYKRKLQTHVFDMTRHFPFSSSSFNGVFCTSTLHYFPKEILLRIFSEADRVLKPKGKIIVDFATDIKRIQPDGTLYVRKPEPEYSSVEGKAMLESLLQRYRVEMDISEVQPEEIRIPHRVYKLSCTLIVLLAEKI